MTAMVQDAVKVGRRIVSTAPNIGGLLQHHGVSPDIAASTRTAGFVATTLALQPPALGAVRTSVDWTILDAVGPDDGVAVESVVTRVVTGDSDIEIDRHVLLLDSNNVVREQGRETWSIPPGTAVHSDAGLDFCTTRWANELAESLAGDPSFEESLASWDGTIGLRCTDGSSRAREVHLRIYRGRVIDVTQRAPLGATFTLSVDAARWIDLVTAERNEFMRRAIRGEFGTTGDGYEYLRLTRPLAVIVEHARAIVKGAEA